MQLQRASSAQHLQEKVGREILVIIDEVDEEGAIGQQHRRCTGNRQRHLCRW